ncbi:hypothetical protein [Demequina sediminicola]|uniref:hypothetical protein n=1 Tax=Demequina sediminicola TaxID=1095026 RepID=UPI000AF1C9FA|nr:hypothetical protein [Demequina sediminicola]
MRSSRLPAFLRVLLVLAVFAAGMLGIVGAWQAQGGAPLGVIVGTVVLFVVFSAGGLSMRSRSRGMWWAALLVLWVVLVLNAPSTEWLALPLIALAAATESRTAVAAGAVGALVVVAAAGGGDIAISSIVIYACALGLAVLTGLGYRRLMARSE